jgi:hypothetical protein
MKAHLVQTYCIQAAGAAARPEPISPEISEFPPSASSLFPVGQFARQPEPRLLHGLMNAVQRRPRVQQRSTLRSKARHQLRFLSFVRSTDRFHLPLSRSEPCRMAERPTCVIANPDRPGHFRAAHSSGHRTGPAPSRGALTMREETMSGTWHWPKLKSKPGIRSRPRTTISTPNIISGRCPRSRRDDELL